MALGSAVAGLDEEVTLDPLLIPQEPLAMVRRGLGAIKELVGNLQEAADVGMYRQIGGARWAW